MSSRRKFLFTCTLAAVVAASLPTRLRSEPGLHFRNLPTAFAALEKNNGARLGVSVLDLGSGEITGYRANERFAMCSTFKFLLAASILQRADEGQEQLNRTIRIPEKPLIAHSPLTEEHAGGEMTLSALCHAALTRSDNTAANLLLTVIGGPEGLTHFARSIGDPLTRLDRIETMLNEAAPGDPRDTTTPAAMVKNMQTLLLGSVLTPKSRDQLITWMVQSKTGAQRLRAAIPPAWKAGDKTGSNGETTSNDIAIFWPGDRPPFIIAAYLTECPGPEEKRAAVLSEIGRLVVVER
jgi:beta-lactamase class A